MIISTQTVRSLDSWLNKSAADIASGTIELAWVGQAGFLIRSKNLTLGIDLYLSDSLATKYKNTEFPHRRMMAAPINSDALAPLDLVLCTHGHGDHMDRETLVPLCSLPKPPLLLIPRFESERALTMGIPLQCTIGLSDRQSLVIDDTVTITAIMSAHEEPERDRWDNAKALGYLIDFGFLSIYHSGDTVRYPALGTTLKRLAPDIFLLPVNGRRDELTAKGIIGNLDAAEAGQLARDGGASLLIPHHFGLFDFNTVEVDAVRTALERQGWTEQQDYVIPVVNEILTIRRDTGQ